MQTKTDRHVELIRNSNEYRALTPDEQRAVDASPLYMRADYILQILAERKEAK